MFRVVEAQARRDGAGEENFNRVGSRVTSGAA